MPVPVGIHIRAACNLPPVDAAAVLNEVPLTRLNVDRSGKGGTDGGKLFIGGLPRDATEEQVSDFFSYFGAVEKVELKYDTVEQTFRGFGFVTFCFSEAAQLVLSTGPKLDFDGKQIECKLATAPTPRNKYGKGEEAAAANPANDWWAAVNAAAESAQLASMISGAETSATGADSATDSALPSASKLHDGATVAAALAAITANAKNRPTPSSTAEALLDAPPQLALQNVDEAQPQQPQTEEEQQQQMMGMMAQMMGGSAGSGGGGTDIHSVIQQMSQSRTFESEEQQTEWQNHVVAVFTQMQTQQEYEVISESNKVLQAQEKEGTVGAEVGQLRKVYALTDPSRTAIGLKEMTFFEKEAKAHESIFIGGLRTISSEETLVKHFSKYGQVTFCEVKRLPDKTSRGFGFMHFDSEETVAKITDPKEQHMIDGKWIDVKRYTSHDQKHPRLQQGIRVKQVRELARAEKGKPQLGGGGKGIPKGGFGKAGKAAGKASSERSEPYSQKESWSSEWSQKGSWNA